MRQSVCLLSMIIIWHFSYLLHVGQHSGDHGTWQSSNLDPSSRVPGTGIERRFRCVSFGKLRGTAIWSSFGVITLSKGRGLSLYLFHFKWVHTTFCFLPLVRSPSFVALFHFNTVFRRPLKRTPVEHLCFRFPHHAHQHPAFTKVTLNI